MPPPSDDPSLSLLLRKEVYSVLQLKPDEPIPSEILELLLGKAAHRTAELGESEPFVSITRTPEEISVVYDRHSSRDELPEWSCIKIRGPMHLGLTGIMCDFTTPLKQAGVPIFALSTWNTDYVLVPKDKTNEAIAALQADGWKFNELQ